MLLWPRICQQVTAKHKLYEAKRSEQAIGTWTAPLTEIILEGENELVMNICPCWLMKMGGRSCSDDSSWWRQILWSAGIGHDGLNAGKCWYKLKVIVDGWMWDSGSVKNPFWLSFWSVNTGLRFSISKSRKRLSSLKKMKWYTLSLNGKRSQLF